MIQFDEYIFRMGSNHQPVVDALFPAFFPCKKISDSGELPVDDRMKARKMRRRCRRSLARRPSSSRCVGLGKGVKR